MKKFALVLVTLTMIFPVTSNAQKKCTASGEYTYYAASNETLDQAKEIALERAKNQIIAENFGTVVGVSNSTVVKNDNGQSDVKFISFGESEVRGEWLETIGEPHYENPYFENGILVVKVNVKGVIREIISSKIQFDARILRNGDGNKFESERFVHGDQIFVSFVSPTSGYFAIFLSDGKTVSRLLPLQNSTEGSVEVEGGKEYVFFRRNDGQSFYQMTCGDQSEVNRFCFVFSSHRFARPLDSRPDYGFPSELSFEDFNRWLAKCRKQDVEMSVQYKDIIISK